MKGEQGSDSMAALRTTALVTVVIGAIAAIGLWRHAPQRPPPLLAVLFVVWVSAPFVLLGVANLFSPRWPAAVRRTLYFATLVITVASLAIYIDNNIAHRTTHPAGVWVAVPPASVILGGIALALAALRARNIKLEK